MRLSGLTGPHLARLPSNRKGRLAAPAEKSHARHDTLCALCPMPAH
jgi:hypothetical protein